MCVFFHSYIFFILIILKKEHYSVTKPNASALGRGFRRVMKKFFRALQVITSVTKKAPLMSGAKKTRVESPYHHGPGYVGDSVGSYSLVVNT